MRTSLIRPFFKIYGNESLKLLNEATVWDDIRNPANSAGPGNTNPVFGSFITDGSGSIGVYSQNFAAPGAAERDLMFDVQFPHSIKTGSTIYPHIHWSPTTTDTGNVGWGLEYSEANIDEAFPLTETDKKPAAVSGVAFSHQMFSWDPITKTNRNISAMFKCRVFRVTNTEGIDTYDAIVALHEFDIHFEIDMLGSRQPFTK